MSPVATGGTRREQHSQWSRNWALARLHNDTRRDGLFADVRLMPCAGQDGCPAADRFAVCREVDAQSGSGCGGGS